MKYFISSPNTTLNSVINEFKRCRRSFATPTLRSLRRSNNTASKRRPSWGTPRPPPSTTSSKPNQTSTKDPIRTPLQPCLPLSETLATTNENFISPKKSCNFPSFKSDNNTFRTPERMQPEPVLAKLVSSNRGSPLAQTGPIHGRAATPLVNNKSRKTTTEQVYGGGRCIPVLQGVLYKKSGSSLGRKEKYQLNFKYYFYRTAYKPPSRFSELCWF